MQHLTCTILLEHDLRPDASQNPAALEKIRQLEAAKGILPHEDEVEESFGIPTFTQHINDVICDEEGQAAFECELEPRKDPNMKVEWQLNGKPICIGSRILANMDFGQVTLDIQGVQMADAGVISCIASNKAGTATTTGTLKVNLAKDVVSGTLHPAGQSGLDNIRKIEGISLDLEDAPEDEVIANFEKPVFTSQLPENVSTGQDLHLECTVEPKNDPNLKINWYHNGLPLTNATRIMAKNDFGFVTLDISDMTAPRDEGVYTCKAVNNAGEAVVFTTVSCEKSDQIDMDIKHPRGKEGFQAISDFESKMTLPSDEEESNDPNKAPEFVQDFKDVTVTEGDKAYLEAKLEPKNDPNIRIEWTFNGKPLQESSRYKKVHSFGVVILDIGNISSTDAGTYICTATNATGSASSKCSIQFVEEKSSHCPKFIGELQDLLNLKDGQSVHMQCALEPVNDPDLKVEWFFNDKPLPNSSRLKTVADFGYVMLDIAGVDSRDSGSYTCRAWNK